MMQRVLRGESYAAIADWLNTEGVEPGPYVRSRHWRARLVVTLLDSPILSGTRIFREMICSPVFRTGRHKSSKNAEPETEQCPSLAHLAPEEHQALRQEIARRRAELMANTKRKPTRQGVPRSRSIWPGQSATCAICGGMLYYSGTHLRCSNALQRHGPGCWNHVQMPAQLARERVVSWLVEYLDGKPALRNAIVESVWTLVEQGAGGPRRQQRDLAREITLLERQSANLATAIAEGGQLPTLIGKLRAVENTLQKARESQQAERKQPAESDGSLSKKQIDGEPAFDA